MSWPLSTGSEPREHFEGLPLHHALHSDVPMLGWLTDDGAMCLDLRDDSIAQLPIEPSPAALDDWARPSPAESASPWGRTPSWVARARTCVRWIEPGPQLARYIAWTDNGIVKSQPMPPTADIHCVRLPREHPLHPGEGVWLASPRPEGAIVHRLDARDVPKKVGLEAIDLELAREIGGHPRHANRLRRLGLRWDGEELYIDRLRTATQHLAAEATLRLDAAHGVRLGTHETHADRVFWTAPDDDTTWVLPHADLARVPAVLRNGPSDNRPEVRLEAWATDGEGEYLGLWRTAGDRSILELWSLRAHDRLKPWLIGAPQGACRLILERPDPAYLPVLYALTASDGDVLIREVEFGDRTISSPVRFGGQASNLHRFARTGNGWSCEDTP